MAISEMQHWILGLVRYCEHLEVEAATYRSLAISELRANPEGTPRIQSIRAALRPTIRPAYEALYAELPGGDILPILADFVTKHHVDPW